MIFSTGSHINVRLKLVDGILYGLNAANQLVQLNSIEDLPDVHEIDVTDGSSIIYNSNNDTYEIRKMDINSVDGVIDGGEF